jgi:hypothetical protein
MVAVYTDYGREIRYADKLTAGKHNQPDPNELGRSVRI